jgi:hypothetical protein
LRACPLAIERGHRRYSAKLIFELIRMEEKLKVKSDKFKLAYAHRAYYARLWLKEHPSHPRFFKLHTVKGEVDD